MALNPAKNLKAQTIEEVIENTVEAIESCKRDLNEIALTTQQDSDDIVIRLSKIKQETLEIIEEVEELAIREKTARLRLLTVSKNLKSYGEEDIKTAYEKASDLQAKLGLLKAREKDLIALRTQLEYKFVKNKESLLKAEKANMHINIALEYLQIDVDEKPESPRENLGAKIITAQEKERMRVAREIHDGPAQALANIIIRAEYCERLFDKDIGQAKKELHSLKEQIREDLRDIRKIIYNLRPMTLDDLGLLPTVKRLIDELNEKQHEVAISFSRSGLDQRMPAPLEIAVFRIIQEALNNVFKHAEASQAQVSIERKGQEVHIEVSDNGKGFAYNQDELGRDAEGYGLLGMQERCDLVGGKMEIQTAPGQGTKIKVKINKDGGKL